MFKSLMCSTWGITGAADDQSATRAKETVPEKDTNRPLVKLCMDSDNMIYPSSFLKEILSISVIVSSLVN